jgi:hypothetical protein
MNTLIFKTNIKSDKDFIAVKRALSEKKNINDCTIDLDDEDKVLRILTDSYTVTEIENDINGLGFYCKELDD